MANTLKVKRSNTALAAPSLLFGELGWNSADSKLYVGNFANANVQLGSVTTLSIVTANGVSGSVATATSTPAITVTLGAITPSSVTVSGVITASAGSAALPSITTTGDTNTGIYFPAADSVSTSVGGVEKLRVDSNGIGLAVREDGGIAPSTYYLTTQAQAGLTILHAAKAGTASAYHTKRHLMAYSFNTSGAAGGNGIMRIKIPVISAGGSLRLTIRNTGLSSATYSRAWEITMCDYYAAGYTFTKDTFSVTGSPSFSRVRLMTDGTDRYLVLGYFVAGAGTVTTASSTTVTGSGTSFLSLFRVGDSILIAGTWSYISAIASDTSLTVVGTLGVNTAVTYSRGDGFAGPQITIDADVGNVGSTLQVNTAFAIDFAQSESTLSLVSAANDIWLTNTNSQHSFVGVGTQRPTSLFHVKTEKIGQGTVSNSAAGTTVTGVNTLFLDTFKVGDSITIPSAGTAASPQTVVISAIASNTSMTTAAITSANSAVSYSLAGGTLFSVAGNGTITTSSSGNTLSGTNTGDQTAASLGLVIGTNVQAYDAGLLSIAAAVTAADRFLYTTALDVYAVGTITTFGRSLVDDADAATARTTLGLVIGTDVAPIASPTFTGIVTTAGQIAFPATVNLSAGANTLDDYEEGTWSPVVTASTPGATPPTFTSVAGTYTKIGRTVTVLCAFTTNVLGTGSVSTLIAGLPFAASSAAGGGGVQLTTTRVSQTVHVASAATSVTMTKYDGTYPVFAASSHVFSLSYTTTS
jgi:hypothetical protein